MKILRQTVIILISILFLIGIPIYAQEPIPTESPPINIDEIRNDFIYQAHVSNIGWQDPVRNGETAGTVGRDLGLEALALLSNLVQFKVDVHVKNLGWLPTVGTNEIAGTSGRALSIEAVKISAENPNIDVYYRVHTSHFGWLGWAKNGEEAGTTGFAFPVEAIEISIVPSGDQPPGDTNNAHISSDQIVLKTKLHLTNIGWTDPAEGNGVVGITGKRMRVEAIECTINDPLGLSAAVGEAHVSNIGWQGEARKNDAIGTTGRGFAIEAFRFRLEGPVGFRYNIYYRAHVADFGWLGWSANGDPAGTIHGNHPVEALEIQLIRKGLEAPGDSKDSYIDLSKRTYPNVYGVPGMRTLQNFLALAMQPVGHTMYVLGGGRIGSKFVGGPANTHIGEWPQWRTFFSQQGPSYNYLNHLYYNYDGLDCVGFVGWTVYNTLNKTDGGPPELINSNAMPQWFTQKGYGTYTDWGKVIHYQPGDILSLGAYGHVYICLGSCPDGSIVMVHAWPPGVEIDGTRLPNGGSSEATRLARHYMAKYYPEYYSRYQSQLDKSAAEYMTNTCKFSWANSIVEDPDGIRNRSAAEVLKILFNEK